MEKLVLKKNNDKLLKVNYANAIKDEDFFELVNTLLIDSSIKMKYTSRLKEAALEFKNCKNCKSLLSCKNFMKGFCLTPKVLNESLTFSYQKCALKEAFDLKNEYLKMFIFIKYQILFKKQVLKIFIKMMLVDLKLLKK